MSGNIAAKIMEYHALWDGVDKSVIADNIEYYLYLKHPVCLKSNETKINKLEEITGSKKHTVYAWLNRSRKDVKVPLADLLNGNKK